MENNITGNNLIKLLQTNTNLFIKDEGPYNLLQHFFDGYPIENINFLLEHEELIINSEGLWILSELGEKVCDKYIDYAIKLYEKDDDVIKSFALQCIFLGTVHNPSKFMFILKGLECNSDTVKINCVFLLEKALSIQIESVNLMGLNKLKLQDSHMIGIKKLSDTKITENDIIKLLQTENQILQLYGICIGVKKYKEIPSTLNYFPIKNSVAKKIKKILEKYG